MYAFKASRRAFFLEQAFDIKLNITARGLCWQGNISNMVISQMITGMTTRTSTFSPCIAVLGAVRASQFKGELDA
jgi:hypothetical protein